MCKRYYPIPNPERSKILAGKVESVESVVIYLRDINGGGSCVTAKRGQSVYESICQRLDAGKGVTLSFSGVVDCTPTFLNAAVGQLYGVYDHSDLEKVMSVSASCANDEDLKTLVGVIENAKEYFKDNPGTKRIRVSAGVKGISLTKQFYEECSTCPQ